MDPVKSAAVARDRAVTVINIRGSTPVITVNPFGKTNIIAVVGKREGKEVLLSEIGCGRTRPYRPTNGPKKHGRNWLGERTSVGLTARQYKIVAPTLFGIMERLSEERVDGWKNPKTRIISSRRFFLRNGNSFEWSEIYREYQRGGRFSVSTKDELLLSDILWAEANSKDTKRQVRGLAGYIGKALARYTSYPSRRKPGGLSNFVRVQDSLQPRRYFGRHLVILMLEEYLQKGAKAIFGDDIRRLLKWDGEETPEQLLLAKVLPSPATRTSGIDLKITTGFERSQDYIVFEVFPKKYESWQSKPEEQEELPGLEEVPF